jgi:hypothetical protein
LGASLVSRVRSDRESLSNPVDATHWLRYLLGIKHSLGNLNNDIGFVATLLAKEYLNRRFGIADFDAAGKAQGAFGIDIAARTADGRTVVGELKTTKLAHFSKYLSRLFERDRRDLWWRTPTTPMYHE